MRVISGRYRGMKLAQFSGYDVRPTSDRVKESLFDIISAYVADSDALDLFCGSGSLGIECLSRGARYVHFNDISKDSIALLNKNLARLKGGNFKVTSGDHLTCLSSLDRPFGLIFLDPPYKSEAGAEALRVISEKKLLSGIAVLERDRAFTGETEGLEMFDERKYGKTYLSFFRGATT